MINEIEKIYKFIGLEKTNKKEAKKYNNDYDTLQSFKNKLENILTYEELEEIKKGNNAFKKLSLYTLYSVYEQSGKLLYMTYEECVNFYIENELPQNIIADEMEFVQQMYEGNEQY